MFAELVKNNRSVRRFRQSEAVGMQDLEELVANVRYCPSAANFQSMKYYLVNDPAMNEQVFDTLAWAAYMKDWKGPVEGERPAAYIVIVHDTSISANPFCDHGIAAQTIMLGAVEKGLNGCMLGSISRKKLAAALDIPDGMDIMLVLALGKAAEEVVVDEVRDGDVKYWRADDDTHHVPKRSVDELIAGTFPASE